MNSLCHSCWDCKYHVVWIPKYRRKAMFGSIRKYLGEIFHELAKQKESQIEEGHIAIDHVHMCISIPPKYTVAHVVGFVKGKSAIYIARNFGGRQRNFQGESFWARGYYVSTVGRDEELIKAYIKNQEAEDKKNGSTKVVCVAAFSGSSLYTASSGSQIQAPGSAGGTVTIHSSFLLTSHPYRVPKDLGYFVLPTLRPAGTRQFLF